MAASRPAALGGAFLGRPYGRAAAVSSARARLGGARPIVRPLNEPGGLIERPRRKVVLVNVQAHLNDIVRLRSRDDVLDQRSTDTMPPTWLGDIESKHIHETFARHDRHPPDDRAAHFGNVDRSRQTGLPAPVIWMLRRERPHQRPERWRVVQGGRADFHW
jgi:hypothetical protein